MLHVVNSKKKHKKREIMSSVDIAEIVIVVVVFVIGVGSFVYTATKED